MIGVTGGWDDSEVFALEKEALEGGTIAKFLQGWVSVDLVRSGHLSGGGADLLSSVGGEILGTVADNTSGGGNTG